MTNILLLKIVVFPPDTTSGFHKQEIVDCNQWILLKTLCVCNNFAHNHYDEASRLLGCKSGVEGSAFRYHHLLSFRFLVPLFHIRCFSSSDGRTMPLSLCSSWSREDANMILIRLCFFFFTCFPFTGLCRCACACKQKWRCFLTSGQSGSSQGSSSKIWSVAIPLM